MNVRLPTGSFRSRRLAGNPSSAIYGTVVTAAVLAVESHTDEPVPAVAVTLVVTLVVFWLAHGYAELLGGTGEAANEAELSFSGLWVVLRAEWPIVESAALPLVALAVGRLFGASRSVDILLAMLVSVLELLGWSALACRRRQLSGQTMILTVVASSLFGFLLIGMKVVVH